MKYRSVIIDDERLNVSYLSTLLKTYCPEISIVATAYSVETGIRTIIEHKPDILFLDIEIRDKTGFDLLRSVEDHKMQVILITAHNHYSLKAFKYSVLDYILKPIDIDELLAAIRRAKARLSNAAEESKPQYQRDSLGIHHKDHIEFIQLNDIIHLESSGGYTMIHTLQKRKIVSTRSLKETESILPSERFLRVHHSHIVNIQHIVQVQKNRIWFLQMCNGAKVPVSAHSKQLLTKALNC